VIVQLLLSAGRYSEASESPTGIRLGAIGGIAGDVDLIDHEATPINASVGRIAEP
jgi:hypothetical protein